MSYQEELKAKKQKVAQALDYPLEKIKVFSDTPSHYRNRMDFVFGKKKLGLRKPGSWKDIVDVQESSLAQEKINMLLKEVRAYFLDKDIFDLFSQKGTYKYALIRCTPLESAVSIVVNKESVVDAVAQIKEFAATCSADHVVVAYVGKKEDMSYSSEYQVVKGKEVLTTHILGKEFIFSIQGFFQVNDVLAQEMHRYVRELLSKGDHLLDLYAGVGTFGIINADLFKKVTCVEIVPAAISCAQKNAQKNGVENVAVAVADTKDLVQLQIKDVDIVITDPARSGMHPKTIREIMRLAPQKIIYVSCNVKQAGRELRRLQGYEVKSVAMFDFFPQTPHCEAVVELVRN